MIPIFHPTALARLDLLPPGGEEASHARADGTRRFGGPHGPESAILLIGRLPDSAMGTSMTHRTQRNPLIPWSSRKVSDKPKKFSYPFPPAFPALYSATWVQFCPHRSR